MIDEYKEFLDLEINLYGFTTTTTSQEFAMNTALNNAS